MRKYILAGLLVWLPLWVTVVVVRFIIKTLDDIWAMVPTAYHPETWLGFHLPGMGLLVTVVLLFVTGVLVTNYLGTRMIRIWDEFISKIPLVRTVYGAVKQVTNAMFNPSVNAFNKVLLVEYPRRGCWSIGFQTNDNFQHTAFPEPGMLVFIPTTPNPTSGFLILVPTADTIELHMPIEEALKLVVSLGVVAKEPTKAS